MPQELAQSLASLIQTELPHLRAVSGAQALERTAAPGSWSRKEELGHLIDSAVNNHVRFVRASIEPRFEGPGYAQNDWVAAHGYHHWPWPALIEIWEQHNRALVPVLRSIAPDKLATPCKIGSADPVTLGFVIEDYVLHAQHHLDHILRRERITQYPSAATPEL